MPTTPPRTQSRPLKSSPPRPTHRHKRFYSTPTPVPPLKSNKTIPKNKHSNPTHSHYHLSTSWTKSIPPKSFNFFHSERLETGVNELPQSAAASFFGDAVIHIRQKGWLLSLSAPDEDAILRIDWEAREHASIFLSSFLSFPPPFPFEKEPLSKATRHLFVKVLLLNKGPLFGQLRHSYIRRTPAPRALLGTNCFSRELVSRTMFFFSVEEIGFEVLRSSSWRNFVFIILILKVIF